MIGAQIDIVDSKNQTLKGLKGIIIDETRNTIKIKSGNRVRNVIKSHVSLMFLTKNNITSKSNGISTIGRQEDKIKKWKVRKI